MTTPEKSPPPAQDATPDAPAASESPGTSETSPEQDAPRVIAAGRPRLIEATVARDRGWNAVVKVVVERSGIQRVAERRAVGEEAVVLRSVAEATLDAIAELTGGRRRFALVGAKRMVAFDAAVLLACVRTVEGPPRKLIGCVPIEDDAVMAVARAVMHATNRIIETIPNGGEASERAAAGEGAAGEGQGPDREAAREEAAEEDRRDSEAAVETDDDAADSAVEPSR